MTTETHGSLRLLERVARIGAWIGGLGLLLVSWLIVIDLAARKLAGVSLGGADELAGYTLAVASAWAFPITLLRRSHIRVDVVYTHLSPRTRVVLDVFALVCLGVFVGTLTWHAWFVLVDSIHFQSVSNTPLQVPQWIPQSLWFAGYAFFLLTIVVLGACALARVMKGRWQAVNALIGIHSVEEGIEEETADVPVPVRPQPQE
ncbi:TRAP transporter small permease subunit [Bordetella genomosp. 1]|uniref:TRAP transporter small permease protein n=1 Tax=Bordetella genomosp. 1 TaxID=1395607 RepID=A0ABX4EZ82_9BORD|nr:TRAP transporter small permease [Bordetella genomosp. 1]OZI58747.1 C4-dicarboxylate ABC transporter permease [Bordetella genomosp. 1]